MSNADIVPRPIHLHEFEPMVGQALLADCTPHPVELVLVEAVPLPNRGEVERMPFSLIFRSKPDVQLVSATYAMRCGEFGPELIFINPIARASADAPAGNYYQAIFN